MIRLRFTGRPLLAAALLAACGLLAGCGGSTTGTATPQNTSADSAAAGGPRTSAPRTPSSSVAPRARAAPAVFVIHIRDFAYLPPAPVVRAGQRVEVINDDSAAHTWSAAPRSNWSYTSGNLEKGQRVTFAGFGKPGRYPFLCYYHAEMPSMNGTVVVTAD